ncbi:hypothetical protein BJ878DRAFT_200078 [Calycina marina]|uniref:Major facilitator superfamily (MFS) profile domain-containing protein n=1 Tax=Calycina marina TaxID=1763456 RepID=A0A9P7ZCK4_9HELO|nr:hypothetical protein BJ878DRAFT_200078 [Calycina marina]
MDIYQSGLLVPLSIGPIVGAIPAEYLGWRAIFWLLVIYGGTYLVIMNIVLLETLRSPVGNGSLSTKGIATSTLG